MAEEAAICLAGTDSDFLSEVVGKVRVSCEPCREPPDPLSMGIPYSLELPFTKSIYPRLRSQLCLFANHAPSHRVALPLQQPGPFCFSMLISCKIR